MTRFENLLSRLTEWQFPPGQRTTLVLDDASPWTIHIDAERNDDLGCLAWELTLRRAVDTLPSPGKLRSRAEQLAQRLTGLPDRFKVYEIDESRDEALLRSVSPIPRDDHVFYHEVLLRGASFALLRRFEGATQSSVPRKQVAFPITHESLVRVVSDLASD